MARSFHKNKKPRDRFTVEIESLDQDGRGVAHREGGNFRYLPSWIWSVVGLGYPYYQRVLNGCCCLFVA